MANWELIAEVEDFLIEYDDARARYRVSYFQDNHFVDDVVFDSCDIVWRGKWETVQGVLTPGGDPLKRCPFCKSRESEHLDGVEHPCHWNYCPTCGARMGGGND